MTLKRLIKAAVLPPAGPLLIALLGFALLAVGRASAGTAVLALGLGLLYLLATPIVAYTLLRLLDRHPPLDPASEAARRAGAIVVLDGGRQPAPREHGGDTVAPMTLERLRHAARLHRATGLPILTSGNGSGPLMVDVLRDDFAVATEWIEAESDDTAENAGYSARILSSAGIEHILLVTHFWHQPRAVRAFRRAGLRVTPAPVGYAAPIPLERGPLALLPSPTMLAASHHALHELLGALWYRLRAYV